MQESNQADTESNERYLAHGDVVLSLRLSFYTKKKNLLEDA